MTVNLDYYVEDITTKLETYDQIRLFRDTSPTGSFATQADTATLVAGQMLYTLSDDSGDVNSVYVIDFHHSTLGNTSEQSQPFYPEGVSLLRLRLEAARTANAGFDGTCSDDGTVTTLVDASLQDSGVDADFLEGGWVYRPNAVLATDMVRRVAEAGFDISTGTLSFARSYSNAPASAEVYQFFNFYPPIRQAGVSRSWDDIIRMALLNVWYVDQVDLGTGTSDGQNTFPLGTYADIQSAQVRRVLRRCTDGNGNDHDVDASTQGMFWRIREDGPGDISIVIFPPPGTNESVIVEANRRDANLYNDTDVTAVPLEYAKKAVTFQLYKALNADQPGKYAGELQMAEIEFANTAATYRPSATMRGI